MSLFLLTSLHIQSQEQAQKNKFRFRYILSPDYLQKKGYKLVSKDNQTVYTIKSKQLFALVSQEKDQRLKLDFWTILDTKKNPDKYKNDPTAISSSLKNDIYLTKSGAGERTQIGDPVITYRLPYKGWSLGINSILFKHRGKTKVYTDSSALSSSSIGSINLGVNYGHTWGQSKFTIRGVTNRSISLMIFGGPTIADLKKETSKDPRKFNGKAQNMAALSLGVNTLLSRNNFGIMIAIGKDFPFGSRAKEWLYRGKTWFGMGLATNFTF